MSTDHPRPDRRPTTGTPRWVKAFGITAVILVVLFFVLHLTGNGMGGHGGSASAPILVLLTAGK